MDRVNIFGQLLSRQVSAVLSVFCLDSQTDCLRRHSRGFSRYSEAVLLQAIMYKKLVLLVIICTSQGMHLILELTCIALSLSWFSI